MRPNLCYIDTTNPTSKRLVEATEGIELDLLVLGIGDFTDVQPYVAHQIKTRVKKGKIVLGIRQSVVDVPTINLNCEPNEMEQGYILPREGIRAGLVPIEGYPVRYRRAMDLMKQVVRDLKPFECRAYARYETRGIIDFIFEGLTEILQQETGRESRIRLIRDTFCSPEYNQYVDTLMSRLHEGQK